VIYKDLKYGFEIEAEVMSFGTELRIGKRSIERLVELGRIELPTF
jgi:hypothetical protein